MARDRRLNRRFFGVPVRLLLWALLQANLFSGAEPSQARLKAGVLVYGGGDEEGKKNSARCFSSSFLDLISENTQVPVRREFSKVPLSEEEVFDFPFCILSGEGFFRFTGKERRNLKRYLTDGGFILASSGCSSAAWDDAFRGEIREVFPELELVPLSGEHPVFSFLFPVTSPRLEDGSAARFEGLWIEGRLALIYSEAGLNDTGSLEDCCCCTGNEVAQSAYINCNIFLYALLGEGPSG